MIIDASGIQNPSRSKTCGDTYALTGGAASTARRRLGVRKSCTDGTVTLQLGGLRSEPITPDERLTELAECYAFMHPTGWCARDTVCARVPAAAPGSRTKCAGAVRRRN